MRRAGSLVLAGLLIGLLMGRPRPASAAGACAALAHGAPGHERITAARLVAAGVLTMPDPMGHRQGVALPAHCLVQGQTDPHQGSDGRPYAVGFELRMPVAWNGRLLFQGGGGLDGMVMPAIGAQKQGAPALAQGFAVLAMDGGHEGRDASFAADQQARLDFAYQALGKALAAGNGLLARFYGRAPSHAYFDGCSNGGREALIAAERYPLDFDGIIAGDPGFDLSHAAIAEAWNDRALEAIAPAGKGGAPDMAESLQDADLKLIADAVGRACDGQDGLVDGIIANPEACHFDPAVLACHPGGPSACLSAPKLAAVQTIFGGAHDSAGRALYSSFPYDTGIGQPGWRVWMLGIPGMMPGLNQTLGADALRRYFLTPAQPALAVTRLDFDRAAAWVAETAAFNDATATDLSSFIAHGGKLLLYQGVSDPVFSATDLTFWFRRLGQTNPGRDGAARLFLVPGMTHCEGGIATDRFDPLSAVVAWVEQGRAPARLVATGNSLPGISRPLCPYPSYARYRGGDPKRADSFDCALNPVSP